VDRWGIAPLGRRLPHHVPRLKDLPADRSAGGHHGFHLLSGGAGRLVRVPEGEFSSVSERVAIHTVTVECTDAWAAAPFWRDFLDYEVKPNHTRSIHLSDPTGLGPDLLLAWTDEAKVGKNRIHFDLRPTDQDAAVNRAVALGATPADIDQAGDESWVVLRDPAGNEFCILQTTDALGEWEATVGPPTAAELGLPEPGTSSPTA
jgi:hypothetical protein